MINWTRVFFHCLFKSVQVYELSHYDVYLCVCLSHISMPMIGQATGYFIKDIGIDSGM